MLVQNNKNAKTISRTLEANEIWTTFGPLLYKKRSQKTNLNDLERSRQFYEKAFEPLGYKRSFGKEGLFYAFDLGKGFLFEIAQYKGQDQLTSVHVAFRAPNQEKVKEFHAAAIAAGGTDNGAPGPRPNYTENYYACFILDPDGHNIEAMFDHWTT